MRKILGLFFILFSCNFAFAKPLEFDGYQYFFHWGSLNRIRMLESFKRLDQNRWRTVVGVKRAGSNRLQAFGEGLYVSELPFNSSDFGTDLVVVKVPTNVNISEIGEPSKRWRLVKNFDSRIEFINAEKFFEIIVGEAELKFLDTGLMAEIAFYLKEKNDILFQEFLSRLVNEKVVNVAWMQQELFPIISRRAHSILQVNGRPILTLKFDRPYYSSDGGKFYVDEIRKKVQSILPNNELFFVNPTEALSILAYRFIDREHRLEMESIIRSQSALALHANAAAEIGDPKKYKIDLLIELEKYLKFDFEIYGRPALEAWLKAVYWIEGSSYSRLPTMEDILQLHRLVYPAEVGGFVAYRNSKQFRKDPNYDPRGRLRNGPIYITRSSIDLNGSRSAFTGADIEQIKANPNLIVHEKKGRYLIEIPYTENFSSEVSLLLEDAKRRCEEVKNSAGDSDLTKRFKIIQIVGELYWDLSSRHIFWDGSGRTVKLIRDWMLLYHGISPPQDTPQNDWQISKADYVKDLRKSIIGGRLRVFNWSRHFSDSEVDVRALDYKPKLKSGVSCNKSQI